jgi:predicted dehydrogenase
MTDASDRRRFLGAAAAGGFAAARASLGANARARGAAAAAGPGPSETVVVGVMGMGGRGTSHATGFAGLPGVEVAYVCDVDERRAGMAADATAKVASGKGGRPPKGVADFRRILDDPDVDALVIATCNHWHAPAAILACAAGKHAYVEKPCSHNPREGELLVAAARKHDRVVQMGNQRRSWPRIVEAIERVRGGAIGRAEFARCCYSNTRPTIGRGRERPVPEWLDYALWQGPAPGRPYRDNILHYNWHWFWHWGNGELGNNGIHTIDVCRWGLDAGYPTRVTSAGGRYRFVDDQETPDTHVVTFEFPGRKAITWEGLSCSAFRPGGPTAEIVFYGDKGALAISGGGYAIHDLKGKPVETVGGPGGDAGHQANFVAAIRDRAGVKPNSEIAEGHRSTLLCHLGNIAHRTGRSLRCDEKDGRILDDAEAMTMWGREYARGWEPKV